MRFSLTTITSLFLIGMIGMTLSCNKKEGCTDPKATNYDENAEENNGNCVYNGKVVFYYRQPTSDSLVANDFSLMKVFVNNSFHSTISPNNHWTYQPPCEKDESWLEGKTGKLIIDTTWHQQKSISVSFRIEAFKDANNNTVSVELWKNTVDFQADQCIDEQLKWSDRIQ